VGNDTVKKEKGNIQRYIRD